MWNKILKWNHPCSQLTWIIWCLVRWVIWDRLSKIQWLRLVKWWGILENKACLLTWIREWMLFSNKIFLVTKCRFKILTCKNRLKMIPSLMKKRVMIMKTKIKTIKSENKKWKIPPTTPLNKIKDQKK